MTRGNQTMARFWQVVICLIMFPLTTRLAVADERLNASRQVLILFKAVTYDHNLKARCPKGLQIGVVSLAGSPASLAVGKEISTELNARKALKIGGLPFEVEWLVVKNTAEAIQAIDKKKINTLYLTPGIEKVLQPILNIAGQRSILVLTGESDHVRVGAAIGAVLRVDKPKILVNLTAAKAQGADLDGRLLRVVDLIP